MEQLKQKLSSVLDTEVLDIDLFTSGQIGDIYKVYTADASYVLKTSQPSNILAIEVKMLFDLKQQHIPVPKVFTVSKEYLLLEYIEEVKRAKSTQELEAAKLLSMLHGVSNESRMYGYYYDTTIGPFSQNNEQTQYNWALFLGQMRIMPMARVCYEKGQISKKMLTRVEKLCRDLYTRIDMDLITPSLLHGDIWGGNVLFGTQGAVLIDPALYYGDKEMELAFILLFDTFGETFFREYSKMHPLSENFYEVKVPIYQIYPLLVHIALYGSAYLGGLEQILKRLKI